jgi:hypothetical protein
MAITNMISNVWSSRLLLALEKSLVFGQNNVTNKEYQTEISTEGDRAYIHAVGDVTVGNYVRNTTVLTYELLTDSRQTLLLDQSKYFSFKVDDLDTAQMKPKIIDTATSHAAYQLAETADTYLAGLYAGATNVGTVLTATSTNIYSRVVDAATTLDTNNVPSEGRFLIVSPGIKNLLLNNNTFLTASSESVLNGAVGRVAGFDVLVSNSVAQVGTSPTRVQHCIAGHPIAWTFAQQISHVEAIRLEGAFADGIRGLYTYGAKVLRPAALLNLNVQI